MNFDPEWRVVVTTTSPFETVQEVISKVHSYDLPMIIYDLAELPEGTLDQNRRDVGHVRSCELCKPSNFLSGSAEHITLIHIFVGRVQGAHPGLKCRREMHGGS